MRPIPNFLIVGVMKGGTSSLASELNIHPDIFLPDRELHYFNAEKAYQKGPDFYRSLFLEWNGQHAVGEKTPAYSYVPIVAERIAQFHSKMKLIWIFREPTARAYSHYWFFVSRGKELLSFRQAVKREQAGKTKDFTMRYLDRGVYIHQVERYLKYFSKEQMFFLTLKNLKTKRSDTLSSSCDFLNVDRNFTFPKTPKRENITRIPKNVPLQYLTYLLFHKKGSRILRFMKAINMKPISGYPQMPEDIQEELHEFYEPYNLQLAELSGLDLSHW